MALPARGPLWYLSQDGSSGWEQNPPRNRAPGPAGTFHLGERARRIQWDPGVMVGESCVGAEVCRVAYSLFALYSSDSEEGPSVKAILPAMPR